MDPGNVKEFGWAEAGEDVLSVELEREQAAMAERVAEDPSTVLGSSISASRIGRSSMRPEIRQVIRESTPEQALNGVWGWVDDDLAFLRPWGFDVRDISVPVFIEYGETDVLVPAAHGAWLAANVPGCVVKIDDEAGHMGIGPEREIAENVRWLRDGAPPPGS